MVVTPYNNMLQPSLSHNSHIFSIAHLFISIYQDSEWGKWIGVCPHMYLKFHQMKWGRVKQWGQSPKTTPSAMWLWAGTARNQNLREQGSRKLPSVGYQSSQKVWCTANSKPIEKCKLQVLGPRKTAPLENLHTSVTTVTLIPLIRWITQTDTHTKIHVLSFKTDTVCMFVVLLIVKHLPVILHWATSDILLRASIFMCITFIGIITKCSLIKLFLFLSSCSSCSYCSSFRYQWWVVFFLSEAQEDALLLAHAQ